MPSPYFSVAEDLEHLRDDWDRDPRTDVIRRGSAILRRLLVDGVLAEAWRHHGFVGSPIIPAPDLLLLVGRDPQAVDVAVAGGAHYAGIYSGGATLMKGSDPPKLPDDVDPSWFMSRPWPLSDFVESAAVIIDGQIIKRREIIKYFANIAGGVHLTRSSRVRKKEEDLARRIRRVEGRVQIHVADGLYFELLSIGQAVAKAADVARLASAIRAA